MITPGIRKAALAGKGDAAPDGRGIMQAAGTVAPAEGEVESWPLKIPVACDVGQWGLGCWLSQMLADLRQTP